MKFNILQNHKANNMNSTPFYTAGGGQVHCQFHVFNGGGEDDLEEV